MQVFAQTMPEASTTRYTSPDNSVIAIVRSKKAPEATTDSRIELRSQSGKLLVRRNYSSEDGEHGYGVVKATWTPDSQFFVYSLESSGGHQSWHSRLEFYGRKQHKILSLDDALHDAVNNPPFVISAPDRVTVELEFGKRQMTISLSTLKQSTQKQVTR